MTHKNQPTKPTILEDVRGILGFKCYDGHVNRRQMLVCIGLIACFGTGAVLFCANSDHPVICFAAFAYLSAIFMSTVRGRLKTVGEEISGGCLFFLMIFFAVLIPPLLVYLLFAKETVPNPGGPQEDQINVQLEASKLSLSNRQTAENSPNIFDAKAWYESIVGQPAKVAPSSLQPVRCRLCRERASKSSTDSYGRSFRGEGLNGPSHARQDFSGQSFFKGKLANAPFDFSIFNKCDMSNADMQRSYFFRASFRYACLRGANLAKSDLTGADFEGADLAGANLVGARIGGASFKNADLAGANFDSVELIHRNPSDSSLIGKLPNFEGSNYEDALHLKHFQNLSEAGETVSGDGYFRPQQKMTQQQLARMIERSFEVEVWMREEFPIPFDRQMIESAIRQSPLIWLPASNQVIHEIIESWKRDLTSVWIERLTSMIYAQIPESVAFKIFGTEAPELVHEVLDSMMSEGAIKNGHLDRIPIGILSEFLNHGINVFDVLREMQLKLSSN